MAEPATALTNQEPTPEKYQKLNFSQIRSLLDKRFTDKVLPERATIEMRRKFDQGDHWQKSKGFIGQLPTGQDRAERLLLLEKGFIPTNDVKDVLDTHIENVLGEEIQISLTWDGRSETEAENLLAAVKEWFEYRNNSEILGNALRGALIAESHLLRVFIPSGMIAGGEVSAKDLPEALSKIWVRAENIESGGVLIDEETAKELGAFVYQMKINGQTVTLAEVSYLNNANQTVWQTVSAHTGGVGSEEADLLLMEGILPLYQMKARALITDAVTKAQQAENLSNTMLTRNNNLAGSRERLALNVQPPGKWVSKGQDADGNPIEEFEPAEMQTGAGTLNFLRGQEVYSEDGKTVKALSNPNVIFTDPVPIDTFVGTYDFWHAAILSAARQRHLLMADDATASGRSRIEARKEFEASLKKSKKILDSAGRWMIEAVLHIAAHFMNQPGLFKDVRVNFETEVSVQPLTSEEIQEIRADYQAGIIDLQTALELRRVKNPQEVIERLKESDDRPEPIQE